MNEARRAILGAFDGSAEAFSPVLYLRGPDGVIFDFKVRKVVAPGPSVSARPAPSGIDPALARLLERPFSLLLGDRFIGRSSEHGTILAAFRDKLQKELARTAVTVSTALPLSVLAQRYALHRGPAKLYTEFQKAFRAVAKTPPFIERLARLLGPGVHTTLLRHPLLEHALAEQQPERTLYVVQPAEEGVMLLRREAGGDWEDLDAPPRRFDLDRELVVLRPYGGYTPELVFAQPLLTEDDYFLGQRTLEGALPRDLTNAILSTLSYRPTLILAVSMYTGHHRALLHRIYPRGIPRGSLAVIDPQDAEREIWEKGTGLPGKNAGIEVVGMVVEDLAGALEPQEAP